MQSKTLFMCLIAVALVSSAFAHLETRRCVEGKQFFDGCNQCKCMDGRKACTRKACDEQRLQDPPSDFWEPIPTAEVPTH